MLLIFNTRWLDGWGKAESGNLSRGLHTFSYYVGDALLKNSAPVTRYFVIPDLPELSGDKISAYEYWFNHGPRKHVDVDPQNPLDLQNLYINIEDVVPNAIAKDYSFDAVNLSVTTPDNVFFGIQAYDNAGHATQAVLSDTFAINVTIQPEFIALENGVPTPTTLTYALLYDVQGTEKQRQVVCQRTTTSGISNVFSNSGLEISTQPGEIILQASQGIPVRICSYGGMVVYNKKVKVGTTSVPVLSGIYMVSTPNGNSMKVTVK